MRFRATLFHLVATLSRHQKRAVFLAVDAVLPPIAIVIVRFSPADLENLQTPVVVVLMFALAAFTSTLLGMPGIKLNAYGRHAIGVTAKFAAINMLGLIAFGQILKVPMEPSQAIEFGMALFLGCVGCRYLMLNTLLWVLRHDQPVQRVLIYGAGETGVHMALALRNHPRIRPIAFVDDDAALQRLTIAGLQVLAPARLDAVLQGLAVDKVLLAMPSAPASRIAQITRMLMSLGLDVQPLGALGELASPQTAVPETNPGSLLGRGDLVGELPDIGTAYRGRVVFVSGAGGSVGSELCRQLIALQPKALVLFERSEIALYSIDRELRDMVGHQDTKIIPVLGSVTDGQLAHRTMLETATDIVFHAAAYKHLPLVEANPVAGLANNVLGTQVFAQAAQSAAVARFVLISTDKAVRPTSIMGATKFFAELVVRDFANRPSATHFSTVRFGNVLGSSGSVLPLFRDQIQRGGPITLTHEDVTRYFMSIAEAARLVLIGGTFQGNGSAGNIYVLDMGKPIKIKTLAERMILAEGLSVKTVNNPSGDIEIVVTGLRRGEKLHEELLLEGTLLPTPHPKILRTQEPGGSEAMISAALRAAMKAVHLGDQRAARAVLATWLESPPPDDAGNADSATLRQAMSLTELVAVNEVC